MSARSRQVCGVVLALLLVLPLGGTSFGAMAPAAPPQTDQPATDNTVTRIEVGANGTARWTVTVRTRLDTNESLQAYERFQDRFRSNRSDYLDDFQQSMEGIVGSASQELNRSMNATNFSASTTTQSVPRRWGIVRYEFAWTGFARVGDDAIQVGDVFQSGFFIAENDTLEIVPPDGYTVSSVSPEPDERENETLTWIGREDFADDQPAVSFEPSDSESSTGPSSSGGLPWLPVLVLVALLLGAGGIYLAYRRRHSTKPAEQPEDPSATESVTALPPDERVISLLEANDGQLKQSAIVAEVDWSKSKVSRVVNRLHEDGRIEKTPIGRENLVSLPDEE